MKLRVLHHDKCFDGTASAALFTRFYKECVNPEAAFEYTGLVHRAGSLFEESQFDGDENAIVDFKYSTSPRVTWWFDHHQSAFMSHNEQEEFERDVSGKKFFDPTFKSCSKLIATVGEQRFGFDSSPVEELVYWADLIDGAQYRDASTAVEMREPAMKLAMVIESNQDPQFLPALIPVMAYRSFSEIIKLPSVAGLIPPLLQRHLESIEVLRKRIEFVDGTLFFDVCDLDLEGYNKFIPYFLYPDATYCVGLSKSSFRTKISVGSNPWSKKDDLVNLAQICERYGGGGHARVGAISFAADKAVEARAAAQAIVNELRTSIRA